LAAGNAQASERSGTGGAANFKTVDYGENQIQGPENGQSLKKPKYIISKH